MATDSFIGFQADSLHYYPSNSDIGKKYILNEKLGDGNFGSVYKTTRKSDNLIFAVKVITSNGEGIPNEVKILEQLKHPNIVQCIDVFLDQFFLYIIMEFVEYGDLRAEFKRMKKKEFTEKFILKLIFQVGQALKEMHNKNIIHRDIKPENIFVDQIGNFKIGDFGISKQLDNSLLTRTRTGTPCYAAPEVIKGQPYSFQVDVWSLGCVVYEMMVHKRPFGDDFKAILVNIQRPLNGIQANFSQGLKDLTLQMLKISPTERITFDKILGKRFTKLLSEDLGSETYCDLGLVLPDKKQKFTFFKESASLGNAHGRYCLGFAYELGYDGSPNFELARECYKWAADGGNPFGLYKYGYFLEHGLGGPKDLIGAQIFYKKAAEKENPDGMCAYADSLQENWSIEDVQLAAQFYKKAADLGHAVAAFNYALLVENKMVPDCGVDTALEYYEKAAKGGHLNAMFSAAKILSERFEHGKAFEYLKQASDTGDSLGLLVYGRALEDGLSGQFDFENAMKFYKESMSKGNRDGKAHFGRCLRDGIGTQKNVEEGKRLIREASLEGSGYAQSILD